MFGAKCIFPPFPVFMPIKANLLLAAASYLKRQKSGIDTLIVQLPF